jgi:aminoglycoside 6'-N-acetyltransferase I
MLKRTGIRIRRATADDIPKWAALRRKLWPHANLARLRIEAREQLTHSRGFRRLPLAEVTYLAVSERHEPIGFIEVSLHSRADECTTSPVAYIEGWYVDREYRRQGVGAALMESAERWARRFGCREVASDALLENRVSERAHHALGFATTDRLIHFRKTLRGPILRKATTNERASLKPEPRAPSGRD